MVYLSDKEIKYDRKGREILETIEHENFVIRIVKQEFKEKSLDSFYKTAAKLLYKEAIQ